MGNDTVKFSPCADVDINGFYPWAVRKYTESKKEKTITVAVSGEKGVGMTYAAIRHGIMEYQPKYDRNGNIIVETTRKPKSG
jgi:hypothetical protein